MDDECPKAKVTLTRVLLDRQCKCVLMGNVSITSTVLFDRTFSVLRLQIIVGFYRFQTQRFFSTDLTFVGINPQGKVQVEFVLTSYLPEISPRIGKVWRNTKFFMHIHTDIDIELVSMAN